jgi:hypothetical protein
VDVHSRTGAGLRHHFSHGLRRRATIPLFRTNSSYSRDKGFIANSVLPRNWHSVLVRSLGCLSQPTALPNHRKTITSIPMGHKLPADLILPFTTFFVRTYEALTAPFDGWEVEIAKRHRNGRLSPLDTYDYRRSKKPHYTRLFMAEKKVLFL